MSGKLSSKENRKKGGKKLKVAAFFIIGALFSAGLYFVLSSGFFNVTDVSFNGNKYLSEGRLLTLMGPVSGQNIIVLSPAQLAGRLLASPWIKEASIRKEFPTRLNIWVEEAVPEALLQKKETLFLIDGNGNLLEKLGGQAVPFLPIIITNPAVADIRHETLLEAVSLARALTKIGLSKEKNRIEISGVEGGKEALAVNMDGLVVKVGDGQYEEKFSRLFELSEEIKKRGIAVDYVDLRFANRVIVKPVAEVLK